ncbi:hypothetical protein Tco_0493344 [Tanacetum coccineum]
MLHHQHQHPICIISPTSRDLQKTHSRRHPQSLCFLHPSFNPVTGEPGSTQSSSGNVNSAEPNQVNQPPDHLRRWTKDHPLDNIIGNPSHLVSTRKQLASDALWCCFHTNCLKVNPKLQNGHERRTAGFQAMQDEIPRFEDQNNPLTLSSEEGSLRAKAMAPRRGMTTLAVSGCPTTSQGYQYLSNHKVTKELWERIQLLMQGTSLTKQERECKLYDEFDKFAYKKGESLREFYLRFSLLLNAMNIYNMKLEQFPS